MRHLILLMFGLVVVSCAWGQTYRVTYGVYSEGAPNGAAVIDLLAHINVNGISPEAASTGSFDVTGRPYSLSADPTFYVQYPQGGPMWIDGPSHLSAGIEGSPEYDCYDNSFYSSASDPYSEFPFYVWIHYEPAGPFTLSGPSEPKTYCAGTPITLTGTPGYNSYNWEYQIKNADENMVKDWSYFTSTNVATVDVTQSMLPDLQYKQIVAFRYFLGCGSVSSNVVTGYSFLPPSIKVNDYIPYAPTCTNGSDGVFKITGYSRNLESGEHITALNIYESLAEDAISNDSTGLKKGSYFVVLETNWGGCGTLQDASSGISIPDGPRKQITSSASVTSNHNGAHISCVDSKDGIITITQPSGGDGTYKYFIDDVAKAGLVINNIGAGTHTIRVEDGCDAPNKNTFTTTVPVNPPPALVITQLTPSYCNNTTTSGEITVTKTGGTGNLSDYSYSYDGGAFESSSVKTGLTTGVAHTVIVKDKNGCTSLPQDVVIPNPLSGSSAVTNPACGTGTGKITISGVTGGNGSYTYSLNGAAAVTGNLANGHEFTGLLTSTNSVVVSDAKGCTTPAPFSGLNVSVPALITVSVSSITPESCAGKNDGAITVTASNAIGSVKYSLNGGPLQVSNTFTGQPAGSTYYVTVKQDNVNACTGTSAPIAIGQITPLSGIINETQSILCYGDTGVKGAALDLTPAGGTPDAGTYVYDWTKAGATIATTQDVTGIPAGTYSVTITDKKLCSTTLPNIVVSQPALLTSSISKTDVSCNPAHGVALSSNGAINLTPAGGTTPYQYAWSSNNVSQDLSGLVAGTYDVTITDNNGCVTNNTATLLQPAAVVSSVGSSSDVTCKGLNNGSIIIAATGGTSVFSYSKNGASWQASPVFSSLPPMSYTIITKDQNGCTSQLTQAIAEPNALVATISDIVNTTCGNTNGSAQVNVTGGNGNYQYAWKNTFNQTVSTASVLSNASGDAYTVTVTDSKNCNDSKAALISNSDGAIISISSIDPTTCYDSHDGKAVITVSSGLAPYAITWSNAETGLTPAALLPGDNIVRVSDANNCVAVKLVAVPFPDAIAIDTKIITPPTCFGSTDAAIALTMKGGNGNYSYAWSNGPITSSITNVAAGDYGITVKDSKNCTYTSSIKIDAIPELKLSVINEKLPTCFDGSDGALTVGTTGGNGTYSYQWTDGPAAPQIENIKAGAYVVKVTDVKGCNLSSFFTLNNPVRFTISIEDKTICVGQKYKIASDVTNGSYTWTSTKGFNSAQREVTLTDPDIYTLKVVNVQGCTAQDSFELKTSTDLLHADLLMISEAYQADTVVVIDLSWPLPDAVTWLFPTQASVVEQNNDLGYAFLKFNKTGQYDVAIRANLGECVDTYSQAILIKEGGVTNSGGRQSTINVIQYFEVHPNPSKGDFRILAELSEAQPVKLMLVNTEGNKILINQYDEGKDNYSWNFSIPDLTQGTYFLILKAGKETKAIRMMKL